MQRNTSRWCQFRCRKLDDNKILPVAWDTKYAYRCMLFPFCVHLYFLHFHQRTKSELTKTRTLHFLCVCVWRCDPTRVMASSFLRFLDHTQRRITVGRTPLDKRSARRRDLYLTTHNTHNRQTSMAPVSFKLTISAGERAQIYALDRAATGTGAYITLPTKQIS
jgi:hypothetical protein